MWTKFLSILATYVEMKNGGNANDISKYLRLGASIAGATKTVNEALAAATAKVELLVAEDRGLTEDENAELDASIEAKLAEIANTPI